MSRQTQGPNIAEIVALVAAWAGLLIGVEAVTSRVLTGEFYTEFFWLGAQGPRVWLRYLIGLALVAALGAAVIALLRRRRSIPRRDALTLLVGLLCVPVVGALLTFAGPFRRLFPLGTLLTIAVLAIAFTLRTRPPVRLLWTPARMTALGAFLVMTTDLMFENSGAVATRGFAGQLALGGVAAVVLGTPLLLALRRAADRPATGPLFAAAVLLTGLGPLATVDWPTAAPTPPGATASSTARPSVLVILVDTLRADALSVYGGPDPVPAIAGLAADGIVFDNALSAAPWTLPSFASIMTSRYASEHGAGQRHDIAGGTVHGALDPSLPTLAEQMSEAGYRTVGLLTNTFLGSRFGVSRGFARYENLPALGSFHPLVRGFRLSPRESRSQPPYVVAHDQVERVLRRVEIEAGSGWPFFVLAHFMDPHTPYGPTLPEARRAEMSISELYHHDVRYLDEQLATLLDRLREAGLYDDMLIVLTSDHGEEIDEGRAGAAPGQRYKDHGHTLHQELLHVPLIVKLPGNEAAGTRHLERVSTIDVGPTILAAAGIAAPDSFRGRDLLAQGAPDPWRDRTLYAEGMLYLEDQWAAVRGDHKVIAYAPEPGRLRYEAYDLARDPAEHAALSTVARDDTDLALIEQLVERSSSVGNVAAAPVSLDAGTREQLEALGYLE